MFRGMKADEVRKLVLARPFRPFVVHVADGGDLPVKHEDFVALARIFPTAARRPQPKRSQLSLTAKNAKSAETTTDLNLCDLCVLCGKMVWTKIVADVIEADRY